MPVNPFETPEETARRILGEDFDLSASVTEDEANRLEAGWREVAAARRALNEQPPASQSPPAAPEDRVSGLRAQAAALRASQEKQAALRHDAETLAREAGRANGYPLTDGDVAEMSDADLFKFTGLDGSQPQWERDNDLEANIEAAETEPETYDSPAWKERFAAQIAAQDSKLGTAGEES